MKRQEFDCVVIGAGPGGYVAAIRAAQRGLYTALIEAKEVGGTCLNRGCIPSKALIANADVLRTVQKAQRYGISTGEVSFDYSLMKQNKDATIAKLRKGVEGLIAANKIVLLRGRGRLLSDHEVAVSGEDMALLYAKYIILATGSEPRPLPILPFDYTRIHDSTSLLNITHLPKKLLIVGGGVVGCEFASLHQAFGVEVTILEMLPTILPMEGKHIAETLATSMRKRGIKIENNISLTGMTKQENTLSVSAADGRTFEADALLVSVGRVYNTQDLGLEKAGVIVTSQGVIPANSHMQTNVPHIFAIGDITGKWNLAHVASHQALVAADNAAGLSTEIHYNAVPSVIFTHPEIATIGLTLEKAIAEGYDAAVGKFPFQALGKSQATLETEGFAQIVTDKRTGQILGAQVVGYGAATLIAEMAVALSSELTLQSITDAIHAHPTIAEGWLEAAFLANNMPLHLPPSRP